jgi:polyphosphate kinase
MPRNLDHRIEVLTPVLDEDIRKELWDIVHIQLSDSAKARESGEHFINSYRKTDSSEKVRSQFKLYEYFKNKLEKSLTP